MTENSHPMHWWYIKVAATCILIALLVERFLLQILPGPSGWPVWPGQVLVVVGGVNNMVHYGLLKRRNQSLGVPNELITRAGLYRKVRHPMYLGDLVLLLGLALLAPGLPAMIAALSGMVAAVGEARVEDRYLAARFGADHADWCRRTGLILPGGWTAR